MKNRKGFTMVELLGSITILGILFMIAIPAVNRHVVKSRQQAYDTLMKTCYEAAHSRAVNKGDEPTTNLSGGGIITYNIQTDLADFGYMDPPEDPFNKGAMCRGTVKIGLQSADNTVALASYIYRVNLICTGKNETKDFKTED